LSDAQRGRVLDILIGLSREDYALVSRTFFELGVKLPGVTYDYAAFESDVTEVMQKHLSGKTLSELDFAAYFSDLVTGAIRHRIKMPPTYTMVFKALITVQGIGQRLAPEVNLIEEAQPFVREMLAERYSPARLIRESVESLDALSGFLRQFPFTATQLLRDAEQGRLTVKVEPLGLAEAAEVHARSQQRLARSVGFGACMVAGATALGAPGPVVAGMSAPAFVLFALGVALGFPLLSSLLRRG
jgi:ubiquinone biosynthesis protein